ncbi:MAG: hypothetical protein UZ12_BCD005001561 [Bacteroidetes bacterium OLB12]|nr:MAG: hypothetical protein UZ12_BCD005001561 [Bacteroidetes bacterium OLB12]HNQ62231.1 hypothetical protein [Bacteroidia bacterium]
MEVEIFTLADYAADQGNSKLTVVGTFDTLFTQNLPTKHPHCSLAVRIRIANSEAGKHDFEIKTIGPDGKEFSPKIKGDLTVMQNPNADYTTLNLVMNMNNLKLERAGKYHFEFHFDGDFRSGLTMTVVHGVPKGMQKAA